MSKKTKVSSTKKSVKSPLKVSQKKSSSKLNRFNFFTKKKVIIPVIFVVGFSGVGIYKLTQSRAASLITCDSQWREVPGAGRTISGPDINYIPDGGPFGNTMMLAVRGTDEGVYYQPLWFWAGGHWDGTWRRLQGGSTIDTPRQRTEGNTGFITVHGTNGYTYQSYTRSPDYWSPWAYIGGNRQGALGNIDTTATYGNKSVSVRRNSDNTISYVCRIISGTVR